ncbi:MAG: hypothetical protein ACI3VP_07800 [Oscillospiraceae bacterium]
MNAARKPAALMLAVLLAVGMLAGCADKQAAGGTVESSQAEPADGKTGTVTPAVAGKEAEEAGEEPAEEPVEESAGEPEQAPSGEIPEIGRMAGGVYTNEYLGVACELDENWAFYTAEEMLQTEQTTQELLSDTELGELMQGTEQFLDLQAENVNELTTLNVNYSKLSMQERMAYALMSEEDAIDLLLADDTAAMLRESYAAAGMTVARMEKVEVTFLGETHYALMTQLSMQDVNIYNLQLCFYQCGSYGVTITLGSYIEDKTESLLELFYKL